MRFCHRFFIVSPSTICRPAAGSNWERAECAYDGAGSRRFFCWWLCRCCLERSLKKMVHLKQGNARLHAKAQRKGFLLDAERQCSKYNARSSHSLSFVRLSIGLRFLIFHLWSQSLGRHLRARRNIVARGIYRLHGSHRVLYAKGQLITQCF